MSDRRYTDEELRKACSQTNDLELFRLQNIRPSFRELEAELLEQIQDYAIPWVLEALRRIARIPDEE